MLFFNVFKANYINFNEAFDLVKEGFKIKIMFHFALTFHLTSLTIKSSGKLLVYFQDLFFYVYNHNKIVLPISLLFSAAALFNTCTYI